MRHHLVFFINNMEGGGAERVVASLCDHLQKFDQRPITIVTLQPGHIHYNLPARVQYQCLPSGRFAFGPLKILLLPLFAYDLARTLNKINADQVLSLLVRANLVHILSRWFGNKRRIVISERTITGLRYPSTALAGRCMRALIKFLYSRADAIIAISEGVKASLGDIGVPTDIIEVIYNPQNIESIRLQAAAASTPLVPGGALTLVTSGRLIPSKGYAALLQALHHVRQQFDARLLVLGDGPLRDELKATAASLGLSDSVLWLGFVSNPFAIMAQADIFVFASRFEGFGNVLPEAMACGLPIISTDCPSGPREILQQGQYGILVPVDDASGLAQAIIKLASNPTLSRQFRDLSQKRCWDFDINHISERYLAILQGSKPAASQRPT